MNLASENHTGQFLLMLKRGVMVGTVAVLLSACSTAGVISDVFSGKSTSTATATSTNAASAGGAITPDLAAAGQGAPVAEL